VGEYVVRTREARALPAVAADRVAAALTPADADCEPLTGTGDLRLRCGAADVAVSAAPDGFHVVVAGVTEPVADALVARVASQVEEETGAPCEWVALGRSASG
jgi:hypothetical protein